MIFRSCAITASSKPFEGSGYCRGLNWYLRFGPETTIEIDTSDPGNPTEEMLARTSRYFDRIKKELQLKESN